MNRRRFITTAGILGAAAMAGCVGDSDDTDGSPGTSLGTPPSERLDQPPHSPERPSEDNWNPDWLGSGMDSEPSLAFETVSAPLADGELEPSPPASQSEFAATVLTSTDELESTVEMGDAPDRLQSVDFGSELAVVVESGYGSSSVQHVWKRVEEVEGGIHLNGYRTDPSVGTDDYTSRHSVVVVETTLDEDKRAHVSLTVGADERVNFDSGEGVVTVDRDNGGGTGSDNSLTDERLDQPPHDPERPSEDNWNPDWLGAGMATEPSLPFETVEAELVESELREPPSSEFDPVYAASLLTSAEELESTVDMSNMPERLETVDFESELVVVVESGYGSSSVQHAWQRVEPVEGGIHLHGYRTDPLVGTDDYTSRHSVVVVETPAAKVGRAHVSFTYNRDWRVHFDTSEGVITTGSDDR